MTRVREDAEDIVQQAFQKAFVHLHRFEGKSFSTWLTRIATNEALMLLRKGRGLPEVSTTRPGMKRPQSGWKFPIQVPALRVAIHKESGKRFFPRP